MSIARLCTIPCISMEQLSDTRIRITADDGFRLIVDQRSHSAGAIWHFDPRSTPSAISHFHLRYLIHQALNP